MWRMQKGFTLMELMVVIVIVAILAAVAVPLYINYVKDAQRTEAKGAIAAIISAQQVHLQRYRTYINFSDDNFQDPQALPPDQRLEVDLTEVLVKWKIDVTNATPTGFRVHAEERTAREDKLTVTYTHDRETPPLDPWDET